MDVDAALARWVTPPVGLAVVRATSVQLSMALALCDDHSAVACDGPVLVRLDGAWACVGCCDGPPVSWHAPESVELCSRDPRSKITCSCSWCEP